jgi:hypothetical protein
LRRLKVRSDGTKQGYQIENFVGILTVETKWSISTTFACGWQRYNYTVQECFEYIKVLVLAGKKPKI